MWRLGRCGLAVLVAASLGVACGDDDGEVVAAPAGTAPPATVPVEEEPDGGLGVTVERSRLYEQRRSLAVTLRNGGDATVVVDRVRFGDGPYASGPAAERTVTVPAGAVVEFPVPYGDARCDAPAEEIVVRLHVDGEPASRTVPVSAQIARARERECDAARARAAVALTFADDWELVGPRRARGSIQLEPSGAEDVALVDTTTSIVFSTTVTDPDAGGGRALLEVFAARCDTHALIESKKTFTFTVSLAIDGDDPVPLDVVPEGGPAREVLQQALQGCMDGEGTG